MPVYGIGSGLPALPSGLDDKDAALVKPIYLALNTVAKRVSETTGNVTYSQSEMENMSQLMSLFSQREQTIYVKAGEALAYGVLVTLSLSGGKIIAMKADSTDGTKPAHAVIDAPLGLVLNEYGPAVFMSGRTAGVSGTVFGAQYWLGAAGAMQNTPPAVSGNLVQPVAIGLGTAGIYLNIPHLGALVP